MYKYKSIGQAFLFAAVQCILTMGITLTAVGAENETEILNITVGEPTFMSPLRYQNSAAVATSRTGTIAAFYPKPGEGAKYYRISNDGGRTWGEELDFPPAYAGPMSVGLHEGGVLFMQRKSRHELEAKRIVFSDDFLKYEVGTSAVSMPQAALNVRWAKFWPFFAKGKIVQLPNGDLLGTMYGNLEGDTQYRTMIARSTDSGQSWRYQATVAYNPNDPDPQLAGGYCGYCEPSLALLSNGQLLCIMRTQGAHYAGEYRPYYQCWSDDLGKTWTKPVPSNPHLMNISPTLAVLDNGVLACQYGRPGFHVAFSLDHGHTWKDRVSLSHLPEPYITGQFDMTKAGPNNLVAIGSDVAGVKVWPIFVERVKVSPARVALTGRVVDERGHPIGGALVERGPNRYSVDDWVVDPFGWKKRILQFCQNDAHPGEIIPIEYLPQLSYRSIQKSNGYPTMRTDEQGRYVFKDVDLGEYVLTVECDDYAPTHRHVNVRPQPEPVDLTLESGHLVRGQVVDVSGRRIGGACVVLDQWHCHTDPQGYFHWSVKAPVPQEVTLQVYKKYSHQYGELETTVSLSQLESEPITLQDR